MSNAGSALIDAATAAYPAMAQLYAEDWYIVEAANEGYYVGQGCAVTASGTAGKVDLSAGTTLQGAVEVTVAAVTAATTTITSMADATNPKWVALEIDSSGVLQFNQATAAANPQKPTPTSARVVVAWLYIPANATTVDATLTSANGAAKIMEARQLKPGPSPSGWQYDQNTWVFASGTSFTISGVDATGYLRKGTKISYNDGAVDYGVVASSTFSTNTTVTLITTDDYSIANATLIRPRFSYQALPQAFPTAFNWTPTLSGWSATTTVYRWSTVGSRCTIDVRQVTAGTSTSATHTLTLPVTAATVTNMTWIGDGSGVDNGGIVTAQLFIGSASTTAAARNVATATNVGSGTSAVSASATYDF